MCFAWNCCLKSMSRNERAALQSFESRIRWQKEKPPERVTCRVDEGFDLHFHSLQGMKIKVLPPSSRRQAALVRTAFNLFESLSLFSANKKDHPFGWSFLLAEDEGFEPPQTESESGVLPLHKSSWWRQQDSNL